MQNEFCNISGGFPPFLMALLLTLPIPEVATDPKDSPWNSCSVPISFSISDFGIFQESLNSTNSHCASVRVPRLSVKAELFYLLFFTPLQVPGRCARQKQQQGARFSPKLSFFFKWQDALFPVALASCGKLIENTTHLWSFKIIIIIIMQNNFYFYLLKPCTVECWSWGAQKWQTPPVLCWQHPIGTRRLLKSDLLKFASSGTEFVIFLQLLNDSDFSVFSQVIFFCHSIHRNQQQFDLNIFSLAAAEIPRSKLSFQILP